MVDIRSDEFFSLMNETGTNSKSGYWQMDNVSWIKAYGKKFVSGRGDLYLIIDRVAFDISQRYNRTLDPDDLRNEIDGLKLNLPDLIHESTQWLILPSDKNFASRPVSVHVSQAFSKKLGPQSRVQISLYFMVIVLAFNIFKLAVMTLVLVTDRSAYLVTIGDAMASFLKRPDRYTDRMSMLGKEEIFAKMGLPPLRPVSTEEEANDLHRRSEGTWLPRPRSYMFSINRHGKVIYTLL
jgi:hypothetical protein